MGSNSQKRCFLHFDSFCNGLINKDILIYIMYAEVKNFKSEIGCVIVFKMLIYRKIRGYLEMTNENVRFFSSFFSYKNTYTF